MKKTAMSVLIVILVTTCAFAQKPAPPTPADAHHKPRHGHTLMLQRLDLTDEQREEIDKIQYKTQKEIIPLKAEIELKKLDLKQEMNANSPDRNRIMKLVESISDLTLQIRKISIDQKLTVHSILTPEQREKLKTFPKGKKTK
jgi:Spy/CpxP family protein refolding chaperone